jgi:hypothetical protein
VPRPRLSNLSRLAMLALAMFVSSLLGARPVQAASCHVPERPVLGMRYSGNGESVLQAWEMTENHPVAPPILTQVPCSGEVPHSSIVVDVSVVAAGMSMAGFKEPRESEMAPLGDDAEAISPRPYRLDRPPRAA